MFCAQCGTELDDDCVFCPSCGAALTEGAKSDMGRRLEAVFNPQRLHLSISILAAVVFGVFMLLAAILAEASIVVQDTINSGALFEEIRRVDLGEAVDLYDTMSDAVAVEGFTSEAIEKIVENSNIQSQMASIINGYSRHLLYGESWEFISSKEVIALIEENEDVIYEHTGYSITSEILDKAKKKIGKQIDNYEELLDDKLKTVEKISFVVSPVFTIAMLVTVTVLFIVLALMTNRLKLSMRTCSLSLIAGGIMGMCAVPIRTLVALADNFYVDLIFKAASSSCFTWGVGFVITGMAVLLICEVMNFFSKEAK